MIRVFEVRATKKAFVGDLSRKLDNMLIHLQQNGWEIFRIVDTPCIEYETGVGYFDSVLFTIIAEHKTENDIEKDNK